MKHVLTALMVVGALIFLAAPATADWIPSNLDEPGKSTNHKMHFPQLPDPQGLDVKFGWDAQSEQMKVLADDWRCSATGLVKDIHFWFSSKGDLYAELTGVAPNVHASIWSNNPGTPGEVPSHPEELLWWGDSANGDFEVTIRGPFEGDQGWFNPNLPYDPGFNPAPNDHVYYWQANLTDIQSPFLQEVDKIYWLDLFMVLPIADGAANVELGWKTADTRLYPVEPGTHFLDDAFWGDLVPDTGTEEPLVDWSSGGPLVDPRTGESLDLAFVITPEPGTWAMLLGAGAIGAVAYVRRRRRR